ncbi:MAG: type II secretion system protein [Tepidisphaeraceae bacterium]
MPAWWPRNRRGGLHRSGHRGFTLVELLLVVGIIVVLAGIAFPAIVAVRKASVSTACLSNLRHLAMAFQQYGMAGNGDMPDPFLNKKSWEASLTPYVPDLKMFICSADAEVAPAIGSSYDWRDTAKADTTLAGRQLTSVRRSEAVLVFDALPGWHGKRRINVALIDGSTRQMDEQDCFKDLGTPIR